MAIAARKRTLKDRDGKPAIGPDGKPKTRTEGYTVVVSVPNPAGGRGERHVVGTFRKKADAEAAEQEAKDQISRGTFVPKSQRRAEIRTVADLMAAWLATKAGEVSSNSHADYASVTRLHVLPAFGDVPVRGLTPTMLQAQYNRWRDEYRTHQKAVATWQAKREEWQARPADDRGRAPAEPRGPKGLGPRSVRGVHMRLSQAFDQAVRMGIVPSNPCASTRPPKLERTTVQTWNVPEVEAFLHTAEHRPEMGRGGDTGRRSPDPYWPVWPLLALEGLRKGEALGLRWRDIDWDRGTASIAQTVAADKANAGRVIIQPRAKTAAGSRVVRLTSRTLEALKTHRMAQLERRLAATDWVDHDLIVCTRTGTPVNPGGNLDRAFKALVDVTTVNGEPLQRIRLHDLRHSAATTMLAHGVPLKVASERLGHATTAITANLYQHVSGHMQDEAAAAIDRAMSAAMERRTGTVDQ